MNERTAGGLFPPEEEAMKLLANAPAHASTEPTIDGFRIAAGQASPYFTTDPGTMNSDLHDARVLVARSPIDRWQSLVPILEAIAKHAIPMLIVAPAIARETLAFLVANKLRGILAITVVESSDVDAIAAELGCKVHGVLDDLTVDDLGRVKRVVCGAKSSVLVSGRERL
jgi:chaperonin GroEL (HSP60 family)